MCHLHNPTTMLRRNLGRQPLSSCTTIAYKPCAGRSLRKLAVLPAYQRPISVAPAAVQCIAPSSNTDTCEQAIITFGQAFVTHELHRKVGTWPGQEEHLFAGFSRLLLDSFPDDPVLFVTEQGPAHAAAVVLSSDQLTEMQENKQTQDFNALPGIKQMLQAMPESSLPIIREAGRQLYEAGMSTMAAAGHTSYLKLYLVATRPEAQGSGLGSAVLDAVVAAADKQRMPLYLEAAHDGLVPLYERYGFKSLEKLDEMTLMMREAL